VLFLKGFPVPFQQEGGDAGIVGRWVGGWQGVILCRGRGRVYLKELTLVLGPTLMIFFLLPFKSMVRC
jgi:hypothetical protein